MLARDLGVPSPGRLARLLSNAEFTEWIAFYEVDGLLKEQMSKGKTPEAALHYVQVLEDLRRR
jgi:hypothetical protein